MSAWKPQAGAAANAVSGVCSNESSTARSAKNAKFGSTRARSSALRADERKAKGRAEGASQRPEGANLSVGLGTLPEAIDSKAPFCFLNFEFTCLR